METSLGKRKERHEDAGEGEHGPFFSDIAPVRTAFVVTEQGTGVSKGVGYVSFALKEDAEIWLGRAVRAQWADKKPNPKDPKVEREKKEVKSRPAQKTFSKTPHDPLAIRTIITLWKKIRKSAGAEKASGEEDSSTGERSCTYNLHAHVYKGSLLSVTLKKKRLENLAKPKGTTTTEKQPHTEAVQPATEQDLRALFLPHGPVLLDRHAENEEQRDEEGVTKTVTRNKGFASSGCLREKQDAERRRWRRCNGKDEEEKKERRLEKKMKAMAVLHLPRRQRRREGEGPEDEEEGERVIAVALGFEPVKVEGRKEDVEMASGSGSEDGSDEEDSDSSSASDDGLGVHGGDSDSDNDSWDEDEDGSRDGDVPVKPTLPAPEAGTTLFVRNVPYEATDDELRTLFRAFGPLRYARITMDHDSGRSRGTGFACFWNKEDADKVIEQSDILRSETTGQPSAVAKKNPFSLPSILTPDPSSSLARTLVLHGRTLDVVRAVTRDEGEKLREKQDKRNTYLASQLQPSELERRNASYDSRKRLLKANPSLFISRTRLSVRQLPIFATETHASKRLAIHAVRTFEARKGLTEDERAERTEDTLQTIIREGGRRAGGRKSGKGSKEQEGKGGRPTSVKQSKLSGYLRGLRLRRDAYARGCTARFTWANNNPGVNALFEEWWKDEVKDILKREKAGERPDEDRIKLLKEELEGKKKKEGRGRLIVGFRLRTCRLCSGGVGRRRRTRRGTRNQRRRRDKFEKGKKRDRKAKGDDEAAGDARDDEAKTPPKKKRKTGGEGDDTKASPTKADKAKKDFNPVGSVIGRKRKARKMKKS
ncbi:hypothetical protein BKA70DRAFT_1275304, partial [Coprinopsis sp. MPI-PUGE-AT-0042]